MIILRKLICDDGHVLYSRHRHDFQTYTDKNGKYYMLDGGPSEYYRWSGTGKVVEVSTENSPWEEVREEYKRYNSYSKSYVKLKDISDKWLQSIIDFYMDDKYGKSIFYLALKEKLYRAENELFVEEEKYYYLD